MGKAKYQDLSPKQKKIAKLANPKNEINAVDLVLSFLYFISLLAYYFYYLNNSYLLLIYYYYY